MKQENISHYSLTDSEFEEAFVNRTLNPALFSHEAHLRLAWVYLNQYGLEKAIENICGQLLAYVSALGAAHKYNKTLTIAAIRAVYHFKAKSQTTNFKSFIVENPRLKFNFKELISFHYATDIFHSERAKLEYMEPELLPFD